MNKTLVLFLLVLAYPSGCWAQDFLNKVTKEELLEQQNPEFPEADAAILEEWGTVYFDYIPTLGFQMVQETSRKIKVYTQDGIPGIDIAVNYYVGKNVNETVKIDQVTTYNLQEDGTIKKTKAKNDAVFEDRKSENWKQKKVLAPDVKPGSIVEYSYTVRTDYLNEIPAWTFQNNIPTIKTSYRVRIPEYLIYTTRIKGDAPIDIEKDNKKRRLRLSNSANAREMDMTENILLYSATNLPALEEEPYVDNLENYRPSVAFDLSVIQFPNQPIKKISLSNEDLVKEIYNNKYFREQLKQTKYFESIIDLEQYKDLSDLEKTQKILDLVKSTVSWNQKNGYYSSEGVKKAFDAKTGNVADINLMLTSMLNYVGVESYPVLISTKSNGIDLSIQKSSFNRVISSALIGEDILFLDATNPFTTLNIIPTSNLNWEGILMKSAEEFYFAQMFPTFYSVGLENYHISLEPNGKAFGQVLLSYNGYMGYNVRNNIQGKSQEEIMNDFEKNSHNTKITSVRVYNLENTQKDLRFIYSFEKNDAASVIDDELYFNPTQFYSFKNPFKANKRDLPITYSYPTLDNFQASISIPANYKVEYLPSALTIQEEELGLQADYHVEQKEDKIIVSLEFSISENKIEPKDYPKVKAFYDKLVNKLEDQIIFTPSK
ncbi:DUF3857 domain-containing protein [Myroides sp. LJL116]